ncbi:MAG: hypothetical protein M3N16_07745 [Actinomycetota bacterium]|nr:hypothetical protein [Actinomycetota bacterium]
MSRRVLVSIVLIVALALLAPSSASALVRVNKGMFGVSLGKTQKQVKRKLGRPNDVERNRRLREIDWFYDRRQLMVSFKARTRRVVSLVTSNPRERTASGVGVGSTEQEVVAGVPGATCSTRENRRFCAVFGATAATFFNLEAGRVETVVILR